jgi:hypothetical protein
MIGGECCQIFVCRHTTLLVIARELVTILIIYLFSLVASGLWRCWIILTALLLSGCELGASTVYSWRIRSSGWYLGACRSVLLPLNVIPCPCIFWTGIMKRISLVIRTSYQYRRNLTMKVTVFRDVVPWGLVEGHKLFKGMCCFYIKCVSRFVTWKRILKILPQG